MTQRTERDRRSRAHGDDGAVVVEFALIMTLLFLLVFGIISFGLILSFKQDLTRAAAEGARAGAVALPAPGQTYDEAALLAAQTATGEAVEGIGGSFGGGVGCARPGIDCSNIAVAACTEDPSHQCVTVELVFDYEDYPLFGRIPLVSQFLPDEVRSASVARINE